MKAGLSPLSLLALSLVAYGGANAQTVDNLQQAPSATEHNLPNYLQKLLKNSKTGEWKYPTIPRDNSVYETYFGTKVPEPYRSLENHLSSKTVEFESAQNDFAEKYTLQECSRPQIQSRLQEMYTYERFGGRKSANGTVIELYNPGSYQQLALTRVFPDGSRKVLVDVDAQYEKTYTMIRVFSVSPDGKHVAYSLSRKGSDWEEVHVISAEGNKLPIKVLWSKFNDSLSWERDSSGFYLYKYKQPDNTTPDQAGLDNEESQYTGYWFRSLDPSVPDELVPESATASNPRALAIEQFGDLKGNGKIIEVDEKYTLFSVKGTELNGNKAKVFLKDNESRFSSEFIPILSKHDDAYKEVVEVEGRVASIITDIDANNRRLIKVSLDEPDVIIPAIPELKDRLLVSIVRGNKNKIVGIYQWDAIGKLELFDKATEKHLGSIPVEFGNIINATLNADDSEVTYTVQNFISIEQKFVYNFNTKQTRKLSERSIPGFDSSNYVQKQALYKSKDGQEVSVVFAHKKGLKPDGSHPVIVYAYGGFRIQQNPRYRPSWAYLLEKEDGVVAIASIRGGLERGEAWYQAGRLFNKQRSYDDLIAAVQYFQTNPENKFGSKDTVFINGGSNGGLMAAATCNQNPTLLGGCIPEVGVQDLVRFPLFTVGGGWAGDYGHANSSKAEFENIYKISPLHNVLPKKGKGVKTYPPLFITTGEYDDRVSKLHTFKYAAEIQYQHRYAKHPALLYVHWKSGHGSGRSIKQSIKADVNVLSFIKLAIKANQGKLAYAPEAITENVNEIN